MNHPIAQFSSGAAEHGSTVVYRAPMQEYTTFRIGGAAEVLVTPHSEKAACYLIQSARSLGIRLTILGAGSNVLCPDEGIGGAVLRMAEGITDLRQVDETHIYCGAGVKLITLCNAALSMGLTGLEFAYGIPGSAGGAVFMNAGAYGGEMREVVEEVTHVDANGLPGTFTNSEADFSYRHSKYEENGFLITGVLLHLKKGNPDEIKAKMEELLGKRKAKQPLEYPSAGSTFKRPEGYFAGALIEQCGLKGFTVGGAAVSEKHAGFVINKDRATCEDVRRLIAEVGEIVKRETGVTLEPEIRILES